MKTIEIYLSIFLTSLAFGCGGPESQDPTPVPESPQSDTEGRIAAGAQALATVLTDTTFVARLRSRLDERPTGDYEVFIEEMTPWLLEDGSTVGELLAPTGVLAVEGLHLAAPAGVEHLRASEDNLLAWVPPGDEPSMLEAYSADGGRLEVSAVVAPKAQVLVLAINERIVIPEFGEIESTTQSVLTCPASGCPRIRLRWLEIWNDHEPWYKGDPEVYIRCFYSAAVNPRMTTAGSIGYRNLSHVNNTGVRYNINNTLVNEAFGYWWSPTCHVMERDNGVGGLISDRDDVIGSVTIAPGDGARTYSMLLGGLVRLETTNY